MWTLETSWNELLFRAFIIYAFVFIVFKLWGKKHLGEMAPFDLVLLLFFSDAVQNALLANDTGIPAAMISIASLVLINVVVSKLTYRSRKVERFIDGESKVFIRDGVVDQDVLRKEEITEQELQEALREQGVLSPKEVLRGTIETNGKISVIKKSEEGAQGMVS